MSATTTKSATSSDQPVQQEAKQQPQAQLGALEEDDEFEEFPTQDWDESETNLAHLNGGGGAVAADKLWEDNWDDDDVEDEFSVQLRNELSKVGKNPTSSDTPGTASGDAMQH